ncbi:pre-mRNA-splicing factor CWC25 homolog isoform X2 [Aphelocoma coerulescens]|uniref:pre-mRNA-splicing factor CWC25 homolog isoform X2 n=1 Tax=Aphelocoma coerulescens TaxID=39617 RepID=UPI003604D611
MGGGDLNLKKSWHPQTLRNVEKVWKAEQKHEAERRKIEELQRELQEERAREEMQRYAEDMGTVRKREEKLEWMYQGPGGMVNREEYLLGRPVDKFILDKVEDKEAGCSGGTALLPGSIFARSGANSVLDMANKIREDPLFMIRKREEEKKREVLNNPVKMKKIKALLQNSLEKKEKRKKKEKKKKKHKKHRRRSSSSSSSGTEEERSRNKAQKRVDNSSWKPAPSKIPGYGLQTQQLVGEGQSQEPFPQKELPAPAPPGLHQKDLSRGTGAKTAGNDGKRQVEGRGESKQPQEAPEGGGAGAGAGETRHQRWEILPPFEAGECLHLHPGGSGEAQHPLPAENSCCLGKKLYAEVKLVLPLPQGRSSVDTRSQR